MGGIRYHQPEWRQSLLNLSAVFAPISCFLVRNPALKVKGPPWSVAVILPGKLFPKNFVDTLTDWGDFYPVVIKLLLRFYRYETITP